VLIKTNMMECSLISRMSNSPWAPQAGGKRRRTLARIGAAAFSIAMLAAVSVPVSAATTRSATPSSPAVATAAAAHYSPNIPDYYIWAFISYFNTEQDCRNWAWDKYTPKFEWRCYQTQEYDLIVWELDVLIPA
jgi:hypothetical protein